MKPNHLTLLSILAVAVLAGAPVASEPAPAAKGGLTQKDLLRGLTALTLEVTDPGADAQADGLMTANLRQDAHARLKQAGLQVVSAEEIGNVPGRPRLVVDIMTIKRTDLAVPLYAYSVEVQLREDVSLVSRPTVTLDSPIWSIKTVNLIHKKFLTGAVQESLVKTVDAFVADYREANGK
jgi:hypothetical protein